MFTRPFAVCFVAASILGILPFAPLPQLTSAFQAEFAPCGVVERFDLPVPDIDIQHTDFAIYRARFGGLHTGIDVAFEQLGEPVRAVARGRVTYSDPAGWGTEKGVVVIQHTMPDGTLVHSIYGHMEELNGYAFPAMDECVEQGQIVGAIGFPARGRPHLHYEIRTRYWHQGGPGYTETNPLELGWFHPVDFTYLANIWVHPAYRQHISLDENATLPMLHLNDGTYVLVHDEHLRGLAEDGRVLWQFDTLGTVTGLLALPDHRVLASSATDQVLVLRHGSFSDLWEIPNAMTPPVMVGDVVVFMTSELELVAYSFEGELAWAIGPLPERVRRWAVSGDLLAVATGSNELWIVTSEGEVVARKSYADPVVPCEAEGGGFWILSGSVVQRVGATQDALAEFSINRPLSPSAVLVNGLDGTIYLYTGEGRSLYAFLPDGMLKWIAYMPGNHLHAPLLGIGGGSLLYALTTDGQLLAYDTVDGRLVAQLPLYDGGVDGTVAARWLEVQPDDTVRFSAGYLSIVTLDGRDLLGSTERP